MRHFFTLLALLCACTPTFVHAKRSAPPNVPPVVHAGVRYVAPNDNGRQAIVQARDATTDKLLWEVNVFKVPIDKDLEQDVQWVFIKSISRDTDTLVIVAEDARIYHLDLKTRVVTKATKTN